MPFDQPPNEPPIHPTTTSTAPTAFTVHEAVSFLSHLLAQHIPSPIEISGVVSSWKVQKGWASGELCATTQGNVEARIPFSIPKTALPLLQQTRGQTIGNDCVVAIRGTLETRPPWHLIRLQGEALSLLSRSSDVAVTRQQLIDSLRKTGQLDAQQKLHIPEAPKTIGLITAAASAARADIMNTLTASGSPVRVIEAHVTLMGPTAPQQVADAIVRLASAHPELLVVARGGGASAELATFDHQVVAEAIARCPVPVIAAIGHATDKTVADLVAHTAVVTPTAAAHLIVAGHQQARQKLRDEVHATRLAETVKRAEQSNRAVAEAQRRSRFALVAFMIVSIAFLVFLAV